MKVLIYTDGAARGNPDGPGGYGVVLHYTDTKAFFMKRPCLLAMFVLPTTEWSLWRRL